MTKLIDVSDEAEPLPKGYDFSHLVEPGPDVRPGAAIFESSAISRAARPQVAIDDDTLCLSYRRHWEWIR
jgi:hypothetical protein